MLIGNHVSGVLSAALLVTTLASTGLALGAQRPDVDDTVVLVATPELQDPIYGETILIASPLGNDQHIGFILNKPSQYSSAPTVRGQPASKPLRDTVYVGGPDEPNTVFALLESGNRPGSGWMKLGPDLFMGIASSALDKIMESGTEHARFFTGVVVWKPGELEEELKRGSWYVLDADPDVVLPEHTEGLWQKLVHRAEVRDKAI